MRRAYQVSGALLFVQGDPIAAAMSGVVWHSQVGTVVCPICGVRIMFGTGRNFGAVQKRAIYCFIWSYLRVLSGVLSAKGQLYSAPIQSGAARKGQTVHHWMS